MIIRLHTHLAQHKTFWHVHIRVVQINPIIKHRRTSKYDILRTQLERMQDILYTSKPHTVHPTGAISKMPHQSPLPPLAHLLEIHKLPLDLHERHIRSQLTDTIQAATVNMLVRKIVQQVLPSPQTQFLLQHFSPFRPHARQIFQAVRKQDITICCTAYPHAKPQPRLPCQAQRRWHSRTP